LSRPGFCKRKRKISWEYGSPGCIETRAIPNWPPGVVWRPCDYTISVNPWNGTWVPTFQNAYAQSFLEKREFESVVFIDCRRECVAADLYNPTDRQLAAWLSKWSTAPDPSDPETRVFKKFALSVCRLSSRESRIYFKKHKPKPQLFKTIISAVGIDEATGRLHKEQWLDSDEAFTEPQFVESEGVESRRAICMMLNPELLLVHDIKQAYKNERVPSICIWSTATPYTVEHEAPNYEQPDLNKSDGLPPDIGTIVDGAVKVGTFADGNGYTVYDPNLARPTADEENQWNMILNKAAEESGGYIVRFGANGDLPGLHLEQDRRTTLDNPKQRQLLDDRINEVMRRERAGLLTGDSKIIAETFFGKPVAVAAREIGISEDAMRQRIKRFTGEKITEDLMGIAACNTYPSIEDERDGWHILIRIPKCEPRFYRLGDLLENVSEQDLEAAWDAAFHDETLRLFWSKIEKMGMLRGGFTRDGQLKDKTKQLMDNIADSLAIGFKRGGNAPWYLTFKWRGTDRVVAFERWSNLTGLSQVAAMVEGQEERESRKVESHRIVPSCGYGRGTRSSGV